MDRGARDGQAGPATTCWTSRVVVEEEDAILRAWESAVRARIGSLRDASQPIVLDHVGDLLHALARWVETQDATPQLDLLARSHGIQRVSHGVQLQEVVHEHRLLREIIVTRLDAHRAQEDDAPAAVALRQEELARLHEGLDLAVASAVAKYAAIRTDAVATLESRLRLALEASGIGAWDYDCLLGYFELDAQARRLFGLGDAGHPFHRTELLERVDPGCRDRLAAALACSDHDLGLDLLVREKGVAVERWLKLDGRSMRDEHGTGVRLLGTVVDMTEQRHLERTRDRFLAVLGHDLRSPLNAIAVAAHLLETGVAPEETAAIAARMARSVRRMEALIRDLLDYTRAAVGTPLPVAARTADIDAVCTSVLDELRTAHPGAVFVYRPGGDPHGTWDADRLEQVIANLLTNSVKYGRRGSPVTLRWWRDPADAALVLEVHNQGDAIPPPLQPHVFDAFRMGGVTEAGVQSSAGLGLYVVAQIVRAHGGEVAVESTAEAGTTFRVRLPAAPPG